MAGGVFQPLQEACQQLCQVSWAECSTLWEVECKVGKVYTLMHVRAHCTENFTTATLIMTGTLTDALTAFIPLFEVTCQKPSTIDELVAR